MRPFVAFLTLASLLPLFSETPRRRGRTPASDQPAPSFDAGAVNNPQTQDEVRPDSAGSAVVRAQILLDRAHFSPGEIDGTMNTWTQRALDAYTKNGGNANALPADALTHYRITEQDAAGPFTPRIQRDMMAQATLDALNYRDIVEELGEKFHVKPRLLRRLNPEAHFAAGEDIVVPNVLQTIPPVGPPAGRQNDT